MVKRFAEGLTAPRTREGSSSGKEYYRRRLEAVCNNATLALFIMDDHQNCTYMNPAAEKLTGFTIAEVKGRQLHEFVHHTKPDGSPYPIEECPIDQTLWQHEQRQSEEIFVHKNGTFYPVVFTASPIHDGDVAVGTIIEVRDTTREKQADEWLRQSHFELEKRVEQRTAELDQANKLLEEQVAKLKETEFALTDSESQFKEAQRIAHIGDWERDLATNTIRASNEFCRIFFGLVPQERNHAYETIFNLIHPEDRDHLLKITKTALQTRKPFDLDYRIIRPDGTVRTVHVRAEVISEAGNPVRVRGIVQDITERKEAEDEIKRQKELLQKIFDQIPVMISFFDRDGYLKLVNREWERMRGWSLTEIQEQGVDAIAEFYPDPHDRQKVRDFIAAANGEWVDFKSQGRNGRVIYVSWAAVRLSDGTTVSIGKDITEWRRAQEERRQLSRRLITAQEDERRRISRELHDNMGQYLAALILGLESIKQAHLPQDTQNDMLYLKELTEQFEKQVHRFAAELRPTALDDLGLRAALATCVEEWAKRHHKKALADFHSSGFTDRGPRLSLEIEAALYRVVQEALTNVSKHAEAQHVSVILERRRDDVCVIIEDDGKGFDVDAIMNARLPDRRLGLIGMRERVELVGGTLTVDSGAGTTIVVRVPLDREVSK